MQPGRLFSLVKNYDTYVGRIAFAVLGVNFLLALVIGSIFGSFMSALLIGLLLIIGPVLVEKVMPQSPLSAGVMAFSYMSFVTLHVHLSFGLIEMHFGYFALLAILYAYQRASTIFIAAVTAAVYHLGFAFLQSSGVPVYLYPPNSQLVAAAGIPVFVLVHAAYVVVEAAVLMIMATLSRPITQTAQTIIHSNEQMLSSDGTIDLTAAIDDNGNELVQRYALLLNSVREVVGRVSATSHKLQSSLGTMSETYRDVSERVQHQRDQTEKMVSSLENVSRGTSSLNDFLSFLNNISHQLNENKDASLSATADSVNSSKESAGLVQLTSQSLSRVDKDTESISGMVASIQGIAEQTNLLALNAAIEAARAGEQGRGFAVVADEVRNLATRAHQATRDIDGIVRQLADGAAEAVSTMQRTVTEIELTQSHGALAAEKMTLLGERIDDVGDSNQRMTEEIEQQMQENQVLSEQLAFVAEDSEQMFKAIEKGLIELTDVEQAFKELNDSLQTFRS